MKIQWVWLVLGLELMTVANCSGGLPFKSTEEGRSTTSESGAEFAEPIQNVSAHVSGKAVLACSVRNLGHYKVAWVHDDLKSIISIQMHIITRNSRVHVTNDKHDNLHTFYLHIQNVQPVDAGSYLCQVNTDEMKTQIGVLNILLESATLVTPITTTTEQSYRKDDEVSSSSSITVSPSPHNLNLFHASFLLILVQTLNL